jgi:endonuclease G, mitochondrial
MLVPALRLEGCKPLVASTALAACTAIGYVFNLTTASQCEERKNGLSPRDGGDESPLYSPVSPIRIFRPNPNLEIAFDVRTKNPVYVLERLDGAASPSGWSGKRPRHHFYESQLLPDVYRSRNSSYHKSGYDRGHMAAAANYATPSTLLGTYNLCNVSPQDPRLNATAWSRLEDWTRRVAAQAPSMGGDAYVVTGPLWLPAARSHENDCRFEYRYPAVGIPPNLVAVPTHFFKLVVVVVSASAGGASAWGQSISKEANETNLKGDRGPIVAYACFVVPNRDVLEDDKDWKIDDGLVAWTDLEAVSGLEFFTELVDRDWKVGADSAFMDSIRRRRPKRIPMQQPQLLLTSGEDDDSAGAGAAKAKAKAKSAAAAAKKFRQVHGSVAHLCPNGTCPRY